MVSDNCIFIFYYYVLPPYNEEKMDQYLPFKMYIQYHSLI